MGKPASFQPDPARVLLVTPTAERVSDFAAIVDAFDTFGAPVALDHRSALPSSLAQGTFGAVILDWPAEPLSSEQSQVLEQFVKGGGQVVLLMGAAGGEGRAGDQSPLQRLAGARALQKLPAGEWFVKTCFGSSRLTARFPSEFAVAASLTELEITQDVMAVLAVSVGYRDRIIAAQRMLGRGQITSIGLDGAAERGFGREIGRLIRRALVGTRPASAGPIGLGVLGYGPYGGMGLYHGLATQATDGLELVSACDSEPARLKAAEEQFPGIRTISAAEELAVDEATKVVVIATPPSTHYLVALSMMRAGKHVVVEKPMCLTLAEADELLRVSEETGVSLTVHQSRRFDADFLAVEHLVSGGALGEVFNVETFVGGFEHPCRAWHSEVSVSGGAVYDWGSHHLDWILQLMHGFPSSVTAHGHKRVWRDVTNLDQVRVRLVWDDGREAEFLQSDVAGIRRPKFLVQGTNGTLAGWYRQVTLERIEPGLGYVGEAAHHAEAPVELVLARYEPSYGLTETRIGPARTESFPFHRNLADHLLLGEPLAVTAESARKVVAVLEAAQRSTDDGNVMVQLPRL